LLIFYQFPSCHRNRKREEFENIAPQSLQLMIRSSFGKEPELTIDAFFDFESVFAMPRKLRVE